MHALQVWTIMEEATPELVYNATLERMEMTTDPAVAGAAYSLPRILTSVAVAAIFLCSLTTNLLAALLFLKKPILRTTSNKHVLHLVFTNSVITVLVMPQVFTAALLGDQPLGDTACRAGAVITTLLTVATILTLLVITVDRFHAISRPLQYSASLTDRRAVAGPVMVWSVALAFAVPPLLGWGKLGYDPKFGMCTVVWGSEEVSERAYASTVLAFCFILPPVMMAVLYAAIFAVARKTTSRARKRPSAIFEDNAQAQPQLLLSGRRCSSTVSLTQYLVSRRRTSAGSRSLLSLMREDYRAAKTAVVVMMSFLVTWAPYFTMITLETLGPARGVPHWVYNVSVLLALTHCVLGPIVYVFISKVVREQVAHVGYPTACVRLLLGRHISSRPADFNMAA